MIANPEHYWMTVNYSSSAEVPYSVKWTEAPEILWIKRRIEELKTIF